MLANKQNSLYTVIDSQLGILVHRVPRQSAIVAIYSVIEDEPPIEQVNELLDTQPDAAAWRSEWAQATAVELELLDERLDDSPTTEELAKLQSKVASLSEDQQQLLQQLRYEGYIHEIRDAKEQLEAERVRLIEVLAGEFCLGFSDAEQQFNGAVIQQLRKSPLWNISMGRHIK